MLQQIVNTNIENFGLLWEDYPNLNLVKFMDLEGVEKIEYNCKKVDEVDDLDNR
jgi:hypothetical protein